MDNKEDLYKKYGIESNENKKTITKEQLQKTMDDIAYCREHLEKINETREALFVVLDQLPVISKHVMFLDEIIKTMALHVVRIEKLLGLDDAETTAGG